MRMNAAQRWLMVLVVGLVATGSVSAQTTEPPPSIAPLLIPLAGELNKTTGEPWTGTVVVAIKLYDRRDDLAPKWIEYQTVTLGPRGRYELQFGAAAP